MILWNDELVLQGCQFWNIPYYDLENDTCGIKQGINRQSSNVQIGKDQRRNKK